MSLGGGKLNSMTNPEETLDGELDSANGATSSGAFELDQSTLVRLDEMTALLDGLSEQIGDVSIDLIRSAIEAGGGRPPADKILARARRSVDKASTLLTSIQP